jgi:hypothetical protein
VITTEPLPLLCLALPIAGDTGENVDDPLAVGRLISSLYTMIISCMRREDEGNGRSRMSVRHT